MTERALAWKTGALLVGLVALLGGRDVPAAEPKAIPLIFDTDICGDCDDVLALAMITRSNRVVNADCSPSPSARTTNWPRLSSTRSTPITAVRVYRSGWWGRGVPRLKAVTSGWPISADGGRPRFPHKLESGDERGGRQGSETFAGRRARRVGRDRTGRILNQPGAAARVQGGRLLAPFRRRSGQEESDPTLSHGRRLPADRRQPAVPVNTTWCRTSRVARRSPPAGRRRWSGAASRSGSPCPTRRRVSSATTPTPPSPRRQGIHSPRTTAARAAHVGPDERPRRDSARPRLLRLCRRREQSPLRTTGPRG